MDGIFTPISLAQVMSRDFTVTNGTGFDIWGHPVPPPHNPYAENTPLSPDVLIEQRPRRPTLLQIGMPQQPPQQLQPLQPQQEQQQEPQIQQPQAQNDANIVIPTPVNQHGRNVLGVLEQTLSDDETDENVAPPPRPRWRTSYPRAPIPRASQNVLEVQVRASGEDSFSDIWPEGDGWPHWTDLEFDLVEPELSEYDGLFTDVTIGEHDQVDNNVDNVVDNNAAVDDVTAIRQSLARIVALREELERDITLRWFRSHGRTVQAPALNVEQILDLGIGRRERVNDRVFAFFRILELFRSFDKNKKNARDNGEGVALTRRDAWMSDLDDSQEEEEEEESFQSILEEMYPGYNGGGGDGDNESAMDVGDDISFSFPNTPESSPEPSESSESFGAGSTLPSTLPPTPTPESPVDPVFRLQHFLGTITPDERVVFRYFLDHPDLTAPGSMRAHRDLHQGDHEGSGHFCLHGDEWFECYLEELLCLYAKYEQVAINEYMGGLNPEDNQNLDDEFLLHNDDDEDDDENDDNEDGEARFRTTPLSSQWRTHDSEGEHSWMLYMRPYFEQGYVPSLGEAEREAWERAQVVARFDAARPPLRKIR